MKRPRIYIDTSVIGGCFDVEFSVWSNGLMKDFAAGTFVPVLSDDDGLHIAVATVAEVDLLVSWNFRHIVHFDKIRLFCSVNLEHGYRPLLIHSPREVTAAEGG